MLLIRRARSSLTEKDVTNTQWGKGRVKPVGPEVEFNFPLWHCEPDLQAHLSPGTKRENGIFTAEDVANTTLTKRPRLVSPPARHDHTMHSLTPCGEKGASLRGVPQPHTFIPTVRKHQKNTKCGTSYKMSDKHSSKVSRS